MTTYSTADEFCINMETRIRRFAEKTNDQRARALVEIAERLANLATCRSTIEPETDIAWAVRFFGRLVKEGTERGFSLQRMLRMLGGMSGNLIAHTAHLSEHKTLLDYLRAAADDSRQHALQRDADENSDG